MELDKTAQDQFSQTILTTNTEMIKDILIGVCTKYMEFEEHFYEIVMNSVSHAIEEEKAFGGEPVEPGIPRIKEDFINHHIPKALNTLTEHELRILFSMSSFHNHSFFIPLKEGSSEPIRRNLWNAGHIILDVFFDGFDTEPSSDLRANINNFYITTWLDVIVKQFGLEVTKEIRDSFNNNTDIFTQIEERGLFKENKELYDSILKLSDDEEIIEDRRSGRAIKKELTAEAEVLSNASKNLTLNLQLFGNKDFVKMIQGKGTNALMKIKTSSVLEGQLDVMGAATFKTGDDFTLIIKDYAELMNGIPTHAWKLFDCFMLVFTQTKDPSIRLPLKDYMDMRGLKDIKSTRKQVLESMDALSKISYEAKEKIKGRWVHSGTISLFGGTKIIKNGIIYFNFNADFYGQLIKYRVMDYPPMILKTNDAKNPNAFYFSRYIAENYRMNEGKDRLNFISVKTMLEKSPKMPTYEEVMNGNRNVRDRIIEPFIRDLDSLDDVYYDIVSEDKETIIDHVEDLTYGEFIKCYLKIDYTDYPKNEARLERKKKHQEILRKKAAANKGYAKGSSKKLS